NGAEQGRDRVGLFEEFHRQDRGQAPENIEVIPFDDVSYRRGDDHTPEILGDFSSHSHISLLRIVRLVVSSRRRHPAALSAPKRNRYLCSPTYGERPVNLCTGAVADGQKGIIAGSAT